VTPAAPTEPDDPSRPDPGAHGSITDVTEGSIAAEGVAQRLAGQQ
jgi:hypothetical protein